MTCVTRILKLYAICSKGLLGGQRYELSALRNDGWFILRTNSTNPAAFGTETPSSAENKTSEVGAEMVINDLLAVARSIGISGVIATRIRHRLVEIQELDFGSEVSGVGRRKGSKEAAAPSRNAMAWTLADLRDFGSEERCLFLSKLDEAYLRAYVCRNAFAEWERQKLGL